MPWLGALRVLRSARSSLDLLPATTTPTPSALSASASSAMMDPRRPLRRMSTPFGWNAATHRGLACRPADKWRNARGSSAHRRGIRGCAMRSRLIAALVALLVLAPAAAASGDTVSLRQVAQRTWSSFVAMTDTDSGLPADVLNADGTTSVQT